MNMTNEKMAALIAGRRKAMGMTQKQLAEKLHVTDKAVSKWERNLSCPDIATLAPLAAALEVTVPELLGGEGQAEASAETVKTVEATLQYADAASKQKGFSFRRLLFGIFSALTFLGVLTCVIVDVGMTGTLTWSLYPIGGIVLGWLLCVPLFLFKKRPVAGFLGFLTLLIFPYLWSLDRLLGGLKHFLPIAMGTAAVGLAGAWAVYFIFRFVRSRTVAVPLALVALIPLNLCVNLVLGSFTGEPLVDVWDVMAYAIVLALAAAWPFFWKRVFAGKA